MELENRENRYRFKGGQRALLIFLGLLMLCLAALGVWGAMHTGSGQKGISSGTGRFDSYHAGESKEYLDFIMLSDSFASSPYGKEQGMFVLFDPQGYIYLACLPADAPYTYEDIYNFTFGVTDDVPSSARVTGYPAEIGEDLRNAAIDYLNEVYYDEEFLNTENFSEHVGDYYLDTAYVPKASSGSLGWIVLAVACTILALIFFLLQGKKKGPAERDGFSIRLGQQDEMSNAAEDLLHRMTGAVQSSQQASTGSAPNPAGKSTIPAWGGSEPGWQDDSSSNAPRGQDPWDTGSQTGNTAAGLVGSLLGAMAGGVLWIIIYQLGFIAGLASLASVTLSLSLYQKFSGKQLDTIGIVFSVVCSLAMMVLANIIAYVITICSAWDWEVNPFTVLLRFGPIMSSADAWGGFIGDLVIGLLLGAFSTWSIITQSLQDIKRKKRRR